MLKVASRLTQGSRSEDRLAHVSKKAGDLLLLADGAGGLSGGARAAEQAIELCASPDFDSVQAIAKPDAALSASRFAGETTLVVVRVIEGRVTGASVGDSEAWVVRADGNVRDVTGHQNRRPLVGSGEALPVAFGPVALNGRLLIASDGLFKYAPREVIASTTLDASLEGAVERLIALPQLRSGAYPNDLAIILAA